MKKMYAIVASVLVSTFAFASEPGDGSTTTGLAVVKKNETTFNLFYKSAGLSNVKVSILDSRGNEVFAEFIQKTDGFIRPYNFEGMSEGEYTFKIKDGEGTRREKFEYGLDQTPKMANILKLVGDKYLVAVKGSEALRKVKIKIFDGSHLIHEQAADASKDFSQLFTIKDVVENVSFEVTDAEGKRLN